MKIVCLNAWGGTLADRMLPWLAAADADVLCLQEIIHSPQTDRALLTYRDGDHVLPQRANLFAEIRAALPGHQATFCPAATGVLWDDAAAVPSQWGLATFVRADIPMIGQVQGFVHKDYSHDGYGAHPRSRCAHGVRLWQDGVGPVSILHMHGLRMPGDKSDTAGRRAQALRLADMAQTLAQPGDRLVVCGDFNVEPDSETFAILARLGLRDLVIAGGHPGTRTKSYAKPGKFADYMLVNDAVTVRHFDVLRAPEISDHCPLILEI